MINKNSLFLSFGILILFITFILYPSFSTDSWAYYELSKSLLNLSYHTHNIRQYAYDSDLSVSFPFLYPLLLTIINEIFGASIFNGVYLNFVILILIALVIQRISLKIKYANLLLCVLFLNIGFIYEIFSARSIPLSILLTLVSINLLFDNKKNRLFYAGVTLGLLCLNRFDSLPFVFIILACLVPIYRSYLLYVVIPVLLLNIPWVIYSFCYFDKLFVSENTILLSQNLPVIDVLFYKSPVYDSFYQLIKTLILRSYAEVVIGAIPLLLYVYFYFKGSKLKSELISLIFCTSAYISLVFISLTGYTDIRYFAPISILYSLHLVFIVNDNYLKLISRYLYICTAILMLLLSSARVYKHVSESQTNLSYSSFKECMTDDGRVLVINESINKGRVFSAKLSAKYNVNTIMQPTNLDKNNIREFISDFDIDYIIIDKNDLSGYNAKGIVSMTNCDSFYKLDRHSSVK
ncbi:hypothetical protein [Photobacterium nomapromontoriensis]|uniref:hypothetical protein n=1 Tax=Photobacterium nomapromontoriensis TaxID=2910237 RepID=UPI003D108ED6